MKYSIAQRRSLFNEYIRENVNPTGMIGERFNDDFKAAMENVRDFDDAVRSVLLGKPVGNSVVAIIDNVSAIDLLKASNDETRNKNFPAAVAYLGRFHNKVSQIINLRNRFDFTFKGNYEKLLFDSEDRPEVKENLKELNNRFRSAEYELTHMVKNAGIFDFFKSIFTEKGRKLRFLEKTFPKKFAQLKNAFLIINRSSNNLYKNMTRLLGLLDNARSSRNLENYTLTSKQLIDACKKYDDEFRKFYNSHLKDLLDDMFKEENTSTKNEETIVLDDAKPPVAVPNSSLRDNLPKSESVSSNTTVSEPASPEEAKKKDDIAEIKDKAEDISALLDFVNKASKPKEKEKAIEAIKENVDAIESIDSTNNPVVEEAKDAVISASEHVIYSPTSENVEEAQTIVEIATSTLAVEENNVTESVKSEPAIVTETKIPEQVKEDYPEAIEEAKTNNFVIENTKEKIKKTTKLIIELSSKKDLSKSEAKDLKNAKEKLESLQIQLQTLLSEKDSKPSDKPKEDKPKDVEFSIEMSPELFAEAISKFDSIKLEELRKQIAREKQYILGQPESAENDAKNRILSRNSSAVRVALEALKNKINNKPSSSPKIEVKQEIKPDIKSEANIIAQQYSIDGIEYEDNEIMQDLRNLKAEKKELEDSIKLKKNKNDSTKVEDLKLQTIIAEITAKTNRKKVLKEAYNIKKSSE